MPAARRRRTCRRDIDDIDYVIALGCGCAVARWRIGMMQQGPLIAAAPGFVGLVAQLPAAQSAHRSNGILSILKRKRHAKAAFRRVATRRQVRAPTIGCRAPRSKRLARRRHGAKKSLRPSAFCHCTAGVDGAVMRVADFSP